MLSLDHSDCLTKHLHKIGTSCLLCSKGEEMTLEHLLNCEELKLIEDITPLNIGKQEGESLCC